LIPCPGPALGHGIPEWIAHGPVAIVSQHDVIEPGVQVVMNLELDLRKVVLTEVAHEECARQLALKVLVDRS
jgi:hypothetical protein